MSLYGGTYAYKSDTVTDSLDSTALYLLSGTIFMSLGTLLWQHLTANGYSSHGPALLAIVFFSCVPVALAGATLFHFLVEMPTMLLARKFFVWLTEE